MEGTGNQTPESGSERLSPAGRRCELRRDMAALHAQGMHCGLCSGLCCTFVANSMRISPLETQDLVRFLQREGRWNQELRLQLDHCIERFRLDQSPGDGRRELRKTYTCPFYTPGPTGCSIPPDWKPYGCLAFNPLAPGITDGGDCASNQTRLRDRESSGETETNQRLRDEIGLAWEKAPIPVALRDWMRRRGDSGDEPYFADDRTP